MCLRESLYSEISDVSKICKRQSNPFRLAGILRRASGDGACLLGA